VITIQGKRAEPSIDGKVPVASDNKGTNIRLGTKKIEVR
jgi:hypothetical protein